MRNSVITFCMLLTLSSCSQDKTVEGQKKRQAVDVIAEKAKVKQVDLYFEALGEIKPIKSLVIYPELSEHIIAVNCKEGEEVLIDDELFKLDQNASEIRMQEAEAELAKADANLKSKESKLKRYHQLKRKEAIAMIEWEEMEQGKLFCEAEKCSAKLRADKAYNDLKKTTILAPFSGKIGKIHFSEHEMSVIGKPLTTLSDCTKCIVEFYITEDEGRHLLQEGKKDVMVSPIYDETQIENGLITYIDRSLNPQTKLIFVKAEINNPNEKFLSGQTVSVKIPSKTLNNSIVIPQKALNISSEGKYVYVVKEDNTVEKRIVQPIHYQNSQVVIGEGLKADELIVLEGHLRLYPGQAVEVAEAAF